MADTIDWPGKSGKKYRYWFATEMENPLMKKEAGNYMFVKQETNGWVPVYIGQTDDLDRRLTNHPELTCVRKNGGTRLMAHTAGANEAARLVEEADLVDYWDPPCNG
jgi:predicted GIY-YIG superfamily endonuclease